MYDDDLLHDVIANSGYEYKKLANDAYLVYNFLTKEEQLALSRLADETLPPQWSFHYLKELEDMGKNLYNRTDIASLIIEGKLMLIPRNMDQIISTEPVAKIADTITDRLNDQFLPEGYKSIKYGVIQRHYEGVHLDDHRDTDCNPNLKYATVVYLNDNFGGGEVYFKDEDLTMEMKPVPRSMLIFNANRLHGTNPVVGKENRYVLTSFISPVGDNTRFDKLINPTNPTEEQHGADALKHFLESGYGGSGKTGIES